MNHTIYFILQVFLTTYNTNNNNNNTNNNSNNNNDIEIPSIVNDPNKPIYATAV
eukprot:CAMPEP_0171009896 /NCGR_PEP_ID=MMETSP0736-20130129/21633_1 /TAXON_ID=186038 /ORGANISM="Fragilariopsis kerguelensis, Strain L26-C5" /LENGTH=53 /DNA_ID=CAMNT_0011441675 /DNA_START=129 /DNA_END=287 /DNA_ORIENTATION=-